FDCAAEKGSEEKVEQSETSSFIEVDPQEEDELIGVIEPEIAGDIGNVATNEYDVLTKEKTDLIQMLAGYIAYRVKKKKLESNFIYGHPTKDFPSQNDWLSAISRGALMRPTREWEWTVKNMEIDFNNFHGVNSLNKDCNVMKTLTSVLKTKYCNIDEYAILCFVRTRTFFRIKAMNKKKSDKRKHYGNKKTNCGRKESKKLAKLQ
ncbi:hypothetical protein J6590_094172, partial [Homalodisca vitripennis]